MFKTTRKPGNSGLPQETLDTADKMIVTQVAAKLTMPVRNYFKKELNRIKERGTIEDLAALMREIEECHQSQNIVHV